MTTSTPKLDFSTASQLSFVTENRGPRGAVKAVNFFDVPDESFSAGAATGTLAALELLNAIKRSGDEPGANVVAGLVIHAAAETYATDGKTESGHTTAKPSKRGAAWGFMNAVEASFMFLAKHGNYQAFLSGKAEDYERVVEAAKAETKARTDRAIAARKAKRLAVQEGGAE